MAEREWISREHKIFRMPNGKLYFRGTVHNMGQKEFPLGRAESLKQALREKERRIQQLLKEQRGTPKSLIRFASVADEVIRHKATRSKATITSAELHIDKHLAPWFDEHCPYIDQIDETVWEQYICDQRAANPKRKLFNDRKHFVMVMIYAYRKGIIQRQMIFRNPDPKVKSGKVYSDKEVSALLKKANPTLSMAIVMAATMGMRRGEILSLAIEDVDLETATLNIRSEKTKTRIGRSIGISPQALKLLKTPRRKTSPFIFPSRYDKTKHSQSIKTAWNACRRRSGVKGRFHDLRHTFLTNAFHKHKLPPQDVCAYAGLDLKVAQQVYLHPTVEHTRSVANAIRVKLGEPRA